MSVRSGGYRTGMSYQWYRSMGHWPHSAFFMRWQTLVNYFSLAAAGFVFGWVLFSLAMGKP